jgi:hypothetical protein
LLARGGRLGGSGGDGERGGGGEQETPADHVSSPSCGVFGEGRFAPASQPMPH